MFSPRRTASGGWALSGPEVTLCFPIRGFHSQLLNVLPFGEQGQKRLPHYVFDPALRRPGLLRVPHQNLARFLRRQGREP